MQNKGIVTKVNRGTTVYFNAQSLHPVFARSHRARDRAPATVRVIELSVRCESGIL